VAIVFWLGNAFFPVDQSAERASLVSTDFKGARSPLR